MGQKEQLGSLGDPSALPPRMVPEELASLVYDFFRRRKTGQITLNVKDGVTLSIDMRSTLRVSS